MKPKFLNHLINLFYPQVCPACGNILMLNEENVCLSCRYLLPKTEYEKNADNPLAQMFYGQVNFNAVTAEFFFSKTGKVQHLLHQLKYEGNQDAGFFFFFRKIDDINFIKRPLNVGPTYGNVFITITADIAIKPAAIPYIVLHPKISPT